MSAPITTTTERICYYEVLTGNLVFWVRTTTREEAMQHAATLSELGLGYYVSAHKLSGGSMMSSCMYASSRATSKRGEIEYYSKEWLTTSLQIHTLQMKDVDRAYDTQRKEMVQYHDNYTLQIREEYLSTPRHGKRVRFVLVTQGPTAGSRRYRNFDTLAEALEHARAWAKRRYRYVPVAEVAA